MKSEGTVVISAFYYMTLNANVCSKATTKNDKAALSRAFLYACELRIF
jgi:hypothetical protein